MSGKMNILRAYTQQKIETKLKWRQNQFLVNSKNEEKIVIKFSGKVFAMENVKLLKDYARFACKN